MFKLSKNIPSAHTEAIWSVAWLSENQVATGGNDDILKKWNTLSGENEKSFEGHSWGISSVTSLSSKNLLASISLDGQVKIWNSLEGKKLVEFEAEETYAGAFTPNGDLLAVTSGKGGISFYDVATGDLKKTYELPEKAFTYNVAVSPDGKIAAFVSWTNKKGLLTLVNLESQSIIQTIEAHAMPIRAVTFSRDSRSVLTGSDDKHVNIYEIRSEGTPHLVASISGHGSWILSISCSFDYKMFATGSSDKTVKVWDMKGQCLHTFDNHTDQVWSVSWNSKSELAAASADKSISIYSCQ